MTWVEPPILISDPQVVREEGETFVFSFNAAAGVAYQIQSASPLSEGAWQNIAEIAPSAESTQKSVTNSFSRTEARFFRVTKVDAPQ